MVEPGGVCRWAHETLVRARRQGFAGFIGGAPDQGTGAGVGALGAEDACRRGEAMRADMGPWRARKTHEQDPVLRVEDAEPLILFVAALFCVVGAIFVASGLGTRRRDRAFRAVALRVPGDRHGPALPPVGPSR